MQLKMKQITMLFGPVQALDKVDLTVGAGEIHGLLGENGAGKSTLMNILAGLLKPSGGEIWIDEKNAGEMTPEKSVRHGIRFIHQELSLLNDLTVYENLFLKQEITRFGLLDKKAMIARSRQVLESMNVSIDPQKLVGELDTSQKQLCEIAKAMLFDAELIIMDEPTTALTNEEIQNLFVLMRRLKERGISIIYISHKMPELFSICSRYTVLRDGRFIESGNFCDIDENKATELLVGRSVVEQATQKRPISEELVLEASGLACKGYFHDVSFSVRKGEVVAVTGLFGDGRGELAECLFGARKLTTGRVVFKNKALRYRSIKEVINRGIGIVPRNRKERSIIKDMSILDNTSIANFNCGHKSLLISKREELRKFELASKKTGIKYGHYDNYITSLSGGNQQKVILSRWLEVNSDFYILDNPTQGIDVGAKFEIYKLINQLALDGRSVLVFSSEFPEIYKIADRCLVMYKGKINGELSREEMTEFKVMALATGSNREATV